MKDHNQEFTRRMTEIRNQLNEEPIKGKVDEFLTSLGEELKCNLSLYYSVIPETDEFDDYMKSEDFIIPERSDPTMTLGEVISHISQEDKDYQIFIDPIYLDKGVNSVNDVLMTVVDENVIIAPVNHKYKKQNKQYE
jgi:hypothetical protein